MLIFNFQVLNVSAKWKYWETEKWKVWAKASFLYDSATFAILAIWKSSLGLIVERTKNPFKNCISSDNPHHKSGFQSDLTAKMSNIDSWHSTKMSANLYVLLFGSES